MMRLDKLLAHMGYGSRKEVKDIVKKGLVIVNGEIAKSSDLKINEEVDEINILGEEIHYEKFIYLMLNKPDGYVSATFDNHDPTVLDLIFGYESRGLFPVGRLDKDTEGLLVLTNDGMLAHELLSPKKHVDKKYYLKYEGKLSANSIKMFEAGITLDDGYQTLPAKLEILDNNEAYVTIKEGKYHQVKRMIAACGAEVTYLERIEFGNLKLDNDLPRGEFRPLTTDELDSLKNR